MLFEWFEDFRMASQMLLGNGEILVKALPLGNHAITLRVTDSFLRTDTDEVFVSIQDTTPPSITAGMTPDTLWPPNHHMVMIDATVTATDACSSPTVVLVSMTSNEADDGTGAGDGKTLNDIQFGVDDYHFGLQTNRLIAASTAVPRRCTPSLTLRFDVPGWRSTYRRTRASTDNSPPDASS